MSPGDLRRAIVTEIDLHAYAYAARFFLRCIIPSNATPPTAIIPSVEGSGITKVESASKKSVASDALVAPVSDRVNVKSSVPFVLRNELSCPKLLTSSLKNASAAARLVNVCDRMVTPVLLLVSEKVNVPDPLVLGSINPNFRS